MFHNGSTYDYHFIVKELAEELELEFECLGENTEKYINFSAPIKKKITKIDKGGNGKILKISYKIKFIESFRFISSSLSSLLDNLFEGLHSDKRTDCKSCLDYIITKGDQLIFRCFECKKNYMKDFNNELIKRFANIYEICNEDINKFIFLLRKGVYPCEYMNSWEIFDETSLPEEITDVDYRHVERVFKNFNNKNLGDYHDLYVQCDTLLLAGVFETFKNRCIEIYELDPTQISICNRISMASLFKKQR